ncbi:hypothetical protein ACFLSU_08025 [Bacteroidota bacterium]
MSIKKFWDNMVYRVGLKKTDKLMIGNVDNDNADHINIEDIIGLFNTDDLVDGVDTKQFTNALKAKVDNLPADTLTELVSLVTAIANAETNANGYTDTAIANLINGAPEAYNTLQEIAAWMAAEDTEDGLTEAALLAAIGAKISQVEADERHNLLLTSSDAFTHAKRGVVDGFEVERLVQLDNLIEDNLRTPFKSTFGYGKGDGKIGTAIPDITAADFGYVNTATQNYIDKHGVQQTAAINEPAIDWSLGYPALLLNANSDNVTTWDNSSRINSENFLFVHKGIIDVDGGSNKDAMLSDGNQSKVILRNSSVGDTLNVILQKGGSDIVNSSVLMPNPSGIVREQKLLSNSDGNTLKTDGVITYRNGVANPYSPNELGYLGHSTGTNKYKGKSVYLSVDLVDSFDSTATTVEEVKQSINNYTFR